MVVSNTEVTVAGINKLVAKMVLFVASALCVGAAVALHFQKAVISLPPLGGA